MIGGQHTIPMQAEYNAENNGQISSARRSINNINPNSSIDMPAAGETMDYAGLTDDDRNYLNKLKSMGSKGAGSYNFTKAPSLKVTQIVSGGSPRQQ
jgi:hypothetical protein